MPIDVSCPKCGSGLPVPEEFAGRTVRCGACAELIPVPGLTPPPLPGAEEPPALPQSRPVATPVARAVPVRAEPAPSEPVRTNPKTELAVAPPRRDRDDDEPARAKPQTKTALFVIAGLVLFGCCGVSVLGFAFSKIANKVAEVNKKNRAAPVTKFDIPPPPKVVPETPPSFPGLVKEPVTPKTRPTGPTRTQQTRPSPTTRPSPAAPADLPQAPSPQGMKGLKLYVSFNAEPIREDTTRTILPVVGPTLLRDGPTRKAARFLVTPDRDGGPPKFACDLSGFVDSLSFKEDDPFTVALWVRGGGQDAIPFAALSANGELAPRLLVRADARGLRVDFHCDKSDPERRFTRTVPRNARDMINAFDHVALTRTPDRTLAVFVDGVERTDAPAESLPVKQPGEVAFRFAGFGLRSSPSRLGYTFDADEFCVFDRALSAQEMKTLAGKGGK